MKKLSLLAFSVLLLIPLGYQNANAQTFLGPTPYLSDDDSPFLSPGGPGSGLCFIEDLEDGIFDFGIVPDLGLLFPPAPATDSVDGDDGVIDGFGTGGHSWVTSGLITFTFPQPVTHAGVVWTDGSVGSVLFEAFGPGMVSLGSTVSPPIGDLSIAGTTAEDSFFGIIDPSGISAIRLFQPIGAFMEVDHIQYCIQPQNNELIGGEIIPIETTSLLLAGAQSFSWMIPVTLSILGIGIFVVSRRT